MQDHSVLEQQFVVGPKDPDLLDHTVHQALLDAERLWPEIEAVVSVHQGVRMTFGQLRPEVDRIAMALLGLGLKAGDGVAIWAPNCVEWMLAQMATASVGMILVNINPAYRQFEAEFVLRKTGVKALIAAPSHKSSNYLEMAQNMDLRPLGGTGASCPDLEHVIKIGGDPRPDWIDFDQLRSGSPMDEDELAALRTQILQTDAVNVQFTSGTTGAPKGATLSHRNLINNGFFVGNALRLVAGDRICIPVPLYHCFGMVMGNLACLTHGATMIYPAPSYDPSSTLKAIELERCTACYGVPTMFIGMLQNPDFATYDLSSLRTGIMAGAPCPIEVMREVVDRMHMPEVIIAYGMTETSPVSFASSIDDPLNLRVETIGRVMPHLEAKITDDQGEILPVGQPGEICVRGYSVMIGYWGEVEATRAVLGEDGWMRTGDLGTIDEGGFCRIVGRIKDMIIRGGENIYPREIEEFLYQHPLVEDVSVVGIPDGRFGEEVCAWVKVVAGGSLSEHDIRAYCSERIAHYKIPRIIRFVTEFPMTITGKIQKFEIRKMMEAEQADASNDAPG